MCKSIQGLLLSLFLLIPISLWAQPDHVFVLIDISGNPQHLSASQKVTGSMHQEANELVKQMIMGQVDPTLMSNWTLTGSPNPQIVALTQGRGQPLIGSGYMLDIMPFGDKDTWRGHKLSRIQSFPNDFTRKWVTNFRYLDQSTYAQYAEAKAGDIALESQQIKSYYLIVVEGFGEDTNSTTYTREEQEILDNYESSVSITSLGILRYADTNRNFTIRVSKVDISKMKGVSGAAITPGTNIQPSNVDEPYLEIVSPKGNKNDPFESAGKVTVSWVCTGCAENTEFTVRLSNQEDRSQSITQKVRGKFNYPFSLQPGLYRISVSGNNLGSKAEWVEVSSGGGGGGFFLFFLIVAILGGIGYFVYKNFIQDGGGGSGPGSSDEFFNTTSKKQASATNTDNLFDGGGGGSGGGSFDAGGGSSSSDSDYF